MIIKNLMMFSLGLILASATISLNVQALTCTPGEQKNPDPPAEGSNSFKVWACYDNGLPNPAEKICLCRHPNEAKNGKWMYPPKYTTPDSNGVCPATDAGYSCTLTAINTANVLCSYVKALWFEKKDTYANCPTGYKVKNINGPTESRKDPSTGNPTTPPKVCCSIEYTWTCEKARVSGVQIDSTTQSEIMLSWNVDEGMESSIVNVWTGTTPPPSCVGGTNVGTDLYAHFTGLDPGTDYSFLICGVFGDGSFSEGESITERTLP